MSRRRLPVAFATLLSVLVLGVAPAAAATGEFRVLVDVDNDAATGCTVTTADGPFAGVEQLLLTTVDLDTKTVTAVTVQECTGGSFGAAVPVTSPATPPWPLDPGSGGSPTVLETGFRLPPPVAGTARLGFASSLDSGGGDALLTTTGGAGGGPILIDLGQGAGIPTAGAWGLLLLAALLAGAGVVVLRRHSSRVAAAVGVVLLVGGLGAAWAAVLPTPDGDRSDWAGISPLATDPSGDAPSQVDILAGYAASTRIGTGAVLVFRLDLQPNAPPVADPDTVTTDEDTPLVITLSGSDPDGDPLTFSITAGPTSGTLGAVTPLTPTSAQVTYTPDPDFNGADGFTFQVDDGRGATDTAVVSITVNPVNDPPVVNSQTFTIPENSPNSTPVGTVLFSDPDTGQSHSFAITAGNTGGAFSINPTTGEITVANSSVLDYETTSSFNLTVQVTDNGTPPLSGSGTVTVDLTNVNDPPVVTPATFTIPENSPNATSVGTVAASDADLPAQTLTFAITAGNTGGAFSINAATGEITVANSPALDYETTPSFSLTVQVTDDGTPPLSGSATVTIDLTNVNEPPTVTAATFTIPENSPNATSVGTVLFSDPDAGQTITLAITAGNTGGAFAINPSTGEISVATSSALDYETTPSFSLTVQATDNGLPPLSGSATVTVNLINVNEPPTALPDSYLTIGNTELAAGGATGAGVAAVTVATNVLANDSDPDSLASGFGNLAVIPASGTSTKGGSFSIDALGRFIYTPPPGTTATAVDPDTFPYTLTDGTNMVTTTVSIVISKRVWYVKNNTATAGTDGTSTDPFDTLVEAETASAASDVLYVLQGDGTTTGQNAGIALKNGQKLLGQGVSLVVDPDDGGPLAPITLVIGNPANKARITNLTGDAVSVVANTANGDRVGVEVRGLDVAGGTTGSGGAGNAIHVTAANAANVGILISEDAISGAGLAGIELQHGSSGTFDAGVTNNTIAATGNGFDGVATSSGPLDLVFDQNTGVTSDAAGFNLDGSGATGKVSITSFAGNVVDGATMMSGLKFKNVVFDANPGDADFTGDTVNAGATVVGSSADRVSGSGVVLDNVSGDLSFASLTVYDDGGTGLQVTGTSLFNAAAGTGFRISAPAGSVDSANGPAVAIGPATLALTLSSVSCTGSPGVGISLIGSAGTFNASGGSIATSGGGSGPTFAASGGSVSATYGGTVTGSVGHSVLVENMTGGTVVLSGAVTDTGTGILMSGNDGATSLTLSGTLALTTTTSTALTATGAGTLTVTDPSSTNAITTTTGNGVNINGVSIGASGVKFTTVNVGDSNAAAPNAANGILLTSVGSNPFTVIGGAIQNVTTRGLDVSGGSGNVSVGASISTTSAGRSVEVTGHTGGTVTVSGAVTDNGLGINLDSNTGGTANFSGAVTVSSGANTGFNATGGGTVNVTGAGSTLTTTTATALNVVSTSIGSSGLTFQGISSNGGANAGIVLNNTGTAGGLTVTGAGGDCKASAAGCSGGSIVNKSGNTDGVTLTNTTNVNLSHMNVSSNTRNGIYGTGVNGFKLSQCRFVGNADQVSPDEAGIYFVDSTGTALGGAHETTFDDLLVQNSFENNVIIRNTSGTITNLAVGTSLFSNDGSSTQAGSDFLVDAGGTANVAVNVTGSEFDGSTAAGTLTAFGLVGDAADTSILTVTASGSTFSNNNVALSASASNGADVSFDFLGNPVVTGSRSNAINVFANANHTGTISGTIRNNVVGTSGVVSSGSQFGEGVRVGNEGMGTVTVLVDGNTIQEVGDGLGSAFEGIYVNQAVGAGTTNATITNNTIDHIRDDRGINSQVIIAGAALCSDISGNTLTNIFSATPIRVRQVAGTHNVHQLDPAGPADPNRLDTANGLTAAQVSVAGTINFNQGTCPQP